MRKLGIQSVAFSVGMMTILSAVVWFVPTDPSLALSVVAAGKRKSSIQRSLGKGWEMGSIALCRIWPGVNCCAVEEDHEWDALGGVGSGVMI